MNSICKHGTAQWTKDKHSALDRLFPALLRLVFYWSDHFDFVVPSLA
jgi:hypothetical protein